jgi:2,3-bisphosphoglycerate-independent phosphoglycerate mutase
MNVVLPDELTEQSDNRIVFLVMDGLGGLPSEPGGRTELETAATPNMDRLAQQNAAGMIEMVAPGITPGSGPGHLALFGYDPVRYNIGRGVLSALGVGFELEHGDIGVRLNFATLDGAGKVSDRRAGRPSDEENRRLVAKLCERVKPPDGVELFFEPEKEHRAVMVVRGEALGASLSDTDPQETGAAPLRVHANDAESSRTALIVQQVLDSATKALADEPKANAILARGFAAYHRYPSLRERFKLRGQCIARYPMYRGVAKLLGMHLHPIPDSDAGSISALAEGFNDYDFHFVHFKAVDSRGEDGDFSAKVKAIEAVDALIPAVEKLKPAALVITGDHSTPSRYKAHSWHPVPVLVVSPWSRPAGLEGFGERECRKGELGIFPAMHLMTLALAHAGRLAKFGA